MVSFGRSGPNDLAYSDDCKSLVAPVLEGGAAFLLLASEALCQSWGGEIRIFPAVPKGFSGCSNSVRNAFGHCLWLDILSHGQPVVGYCGARAQQRHRSLHHSCHQPLGRGGFCCNRVWHSNIPVLCRFSRVVGSEAAQRASRASKSLVRELRCAHKGVSK